MFLTGAITALVQGQYNPAWGPSPCPNGQCVPKWTPTYNVSLAKTEQRFVISISWIIHRYFRRPTSGMLAAQSSAVDCLPIFPRCCGALSAGGKGNSTVDSALAADADTVRRLTMNSSRALGA